MTKLWKKRGLRTDQSVNSYIISEHCAEDTILLPYDITASIAHAKMLSKVGLLKKKECQALVAGLEEIVSLYHEGKFTLKQSDEDCHTAIENFLVKKNGNVGKKIHMGRSRNDQVLVAMRLFSKTELYTVQKLVLRLAVTILSFAKKHEFVPMPGYTHTQQAMPSSVGQWAASFVESLLDDYRVLEAAMIQTDQNPLGSAAGFGTGLPIDRECTTKELKFARTQINTLYCQSSRGKIESFTLGALIQVMLTLGKIANDIVWFTTKEFDFFEVDSSLTTGSSIMPQKKNLDIMEVLRANVAIVISYQTQIYMAGHNLISGYNKDMKITKHALLEAFKITKNSLQIVSTLFTKMSPKIDKLKKSFGADIFATDITNELVKKGVPFRDAYKQVKENLEAIEIPDINTNLRTKTHSGATGNLMLNTYLKTIKSLLKGINKS
ncbi:MAG: argininosuccinate lyase [Candidatus Gracilibacteria bacterium]